MGKSSPSPPDPAATAAAQGVVNQETARVQTKLNNPNSYGPGGAVEREWGPDDTSAVYTYLAPEQQRIYDNQSKLTGDTSQAALEATNRLRPYLENGLDTKGLPEWNNSPTAAPTLSRGVANAGQGISGTLEGAGQGISGGISGAGQGIRSDFSTGQALGRQGTEDYGAQRSSVEQAILSRLNPQFDRDRQAQEARLAAQGFSPGTEGYRGAADELNRSMTDARMQAVLAGGQEQSRLFGLDQSRLGFNNAASTAQTNQFNTGLGLINTAQQQGFTQRAQDAAFGNEAQAQGFGQRAQATQFGNEAQAQRFGQEFQQAGFENAAANQSLNQELAVAQNQNQNRSQQLAERLQLRAQPINEVSALFGLGNGVQVPQQVATSPTQVAAPDYQGLVANNYKAASGAAASNNASTAAGVGAIASVAAIAI